MRRVRSYGCSTTTMLKSSSGGLFVSGSLDGGGRSSKRKRHLIDERDVPDSICGGEIIINKDEIQGQGSFGIIYGGYHTVHDCEVVVKFESTLVPPRSQQLQHEYDVYRRVYSSKAIGVPETYYFGTHEKYSCLAMKKLGPSLDDLFRFCDRNFSLKTVLMLAEQMISRLEYIHSRGFLHRDIKPENFLMGTRDKGTLVFILDFGLSARFMLHGEHIPKIDFDILVGTVRYCSLNAQQGVTQSRRDDMEALGFVLVYFMKKELPWMGMRGATKKKKYAKIRKKKKSTSLVSLCQGLPKCFLKYLKAVRRLNYTERPNYNVLRRYFREEFKKSGFTLDFVFDWNLRFSKLHEKPIVSMYRDDINVPIIQSSSSSKLVVSGMGSKNSLFSKSQEIVHRVESPVFLGCDKKFSIRRSKSQDIRNSILRSNGEEQFTKKKRKDDTGNDEVLGVMTRSLPPGVGRRKRKKRHSCNPILLTPSSQNPLYGSSTSGGEDDVEKKGERESYSYFLDEKKKTMLDDHPLEEGEVEEEGEGKVKNEYKYVVKKKRKRRKTGSELLIHALTNSSSGNVAAKERSEMIVGERPKSMPLKSKKKKKKKNNKNNKTKEKTYPQSFNMKIHRKVVPFTPPPMSGKNDVKEKKPQSQSLKIEKRHGSKNNRRNGRKRTHSRDKDLMRMRDHSSKDKKKKKKKKR